MIVNPSGKRYFKSKRTILYNGKLIDLSSPLVMGILNITPDSFYDGGKFNTVSLALERTKEMIEQGAAIIDIGACSTRPGAKLPDCKEELVRLLPVVEIIKKKFPDVMLSIDTFRSEIAAEIVENFGACIINDISAGSFDKKMFETIAKYNVPYIIMHMQGTPQTMQTNPVYKNVTKEVIRYLSEKVYHLHSMGVSDVIVDPGFGFGKSIDHNYELFNHLDAFRFLELPLLVGVSRKSMIYKLLDKTPVESLNGTTILNTLALQAGANILRVHDVGAAVEAITILKKLNEFAE
jgi:dihydropteroate synthase